jgi:hypothetical protein
LKKGFIIIFVGVVLLTTIFTGCQENTGVTTKQSLEKNVFLESSVVELAKSYLKFYTEYDYDKDVDVVVKVEVQYTFHNIAKRNITKLNVFVEFYDKNNNLLGLKQGPTINNLFYDPEFDYVEHMPNTVTYADANVAEVHHVKIIATEAS